jgi:crossover junction endodeoxyribonuclease RuvC
MLILGIDPGLNTTGYGLIETRSNGFALKGSGFIKTSASVGLPDRLDKIYTQLAAILDKYRPDAMVLEKLYAHYKHPVTAALLGHARGVICMLSKQKNIAFFEYPATRVKKMTTGSGHASKLQMQKMIEYAFGAKEKSFGPADTTDAISLAITHAYILRAKI